MLIQAEKDPIQIRHRSNKCISSIYRITKIQVIILHKFKRMLLLIKSMLVKLAIIKVYRLVDLIIHQAAKK